MCVAALFAGCKNQTQDTWRNCQHCVACLLSALHCMHELGFALSTGCRSIAYQPSYYCRRLPSGEELLPTKPRRLFIDGAVTDTTFLAPSWPIKRLLYFLRALKWGIHFRCSNDLNNKLPKFKIKRSILIMATMSTKENSNNLGPKTSTKPTLLY